MTNDKTIVKHDFRTGTHRYGPGDAWMEYDGPNFAGGPYMNYDGRQISIPEALYRIRIAGSLRRWRTSDEQARRNMEYHLDALTEAYKNGFDPDGKITEYALDNYRWASATKWQIANEICNLARQKAGLPPLQEITA